MIFVSASFREGNYYSYFLFELSYQSLLFFWLTSSLSYSSLFLSLCSSPLTFSLSTYIHITLSLTRSLYLFIYLPISLSIYRPFNLSSKSPSPSLFLTLSLSLVLSLSRSLSHTHFLTHTHSLSSRHPQWRAKIKQLTRETEERNRLLLDEKRSIQRHYQLLKQRIEVYRFA